MPNVVIVAADVFQRLDRILSFVCWENIATVDHQEWPPCNSREASETFIAGGTCHQYEYALYHMWSSTHSIALVGMRFDSTGVVRAQKQDLAM